MKILLDAMSGDNAPEAMVKGAIDAKAEFGMDICLVGRRSELEPLLGDGSDLEIAGADDVITMEDDAASAIRNKKNSSMVVTLRMLAENLGDAVVSAGNTGALLTGATLLVKRISGIRRAAMAPVLPNGARGVCLIDCGANVDCTPEYLLQFAYMGSFYAKSVMGCDTPRVGLLNIGTEESKGTELQKETYKLLVDAHSNGRINFIGNIEGKDLLGGETDVAVADGFAGNIALKTLEGTAKFLMTELKKSLSKNPNAPLVMDDIRGLSALLDPSEIGGTALLGISKPVIKAHGSSDARAIRSAIMQAANVVSSGISTEIAANIEYMKL